jgi:phospholipase D1/2
MASLFGVLTIKVFSCKNLANSDGWFSGLSDPYVWITLDDVEIGRTPTLTDNLNPKFDYEFSVTLDGQTHRQLALTVYDEDPGKGDDVLGKTFVDLNKLVEGQLIDVDTNLIETYNSAISHIHYSAHLTVPKSWAAPSFFPMRENCDVTLYQSAHVDEYDFPPKIYNENAAYPYQPEACWEEIYRKILHAKKFVYITGWSVNTSISLLRRKPIFRDEKDHPPKKEKKDKKDKDKDKKDKSHKHHLWKKPKVPKVGTEGMLTLGELLKMKAEEGVTVILQVWNEVMSMSMNGSQVSGGMMCTHDEETFVYFQNTPVICRLSYRDALDIGGSWIWTHHQKTVMCDADPIHPNGANRRIIAFIGGLDLCDGRWDTPRKYLFRTLKSEHATDFHQVWSGITADNGPRQPWQDIHSRVEGPIARDIIVNFEQRLAKQHPDVVPKLLTLQGNPDFLSVEEDVVKAPTAWNVQLLRSIDSTSSTQSGVEKSIQLAYINAIRKAEHYIYFENQYWMGSSQYWETPSENCPNRIPIEVCLKIEQKIAKNEPFAVYVVIPMYPEGVPGDGAVQEILYWQSSTYNMMFKRIARALAAHGSSASPHDYLNFFCLGNRETAVGSEGAKSASDISDEIKLQDNIGNQTRLADTRRYQVYVHSKMLIVDDVYAIVGSANINERSLAGDRDTEICIGAFQPHYDISNPRGRVHQFRMSVWAEHLGVSGPQFVDPRKCVKEVRDLGRKNWELFADDSNQWDMDSHIMRYPIEIKEDGTVYASPELFPDTKASVIGAPSYSLPDKLTS